MKQNRIKSIILIFSILCSISIFLNNALINSDEIDENEQSRQILPPSSSGNITTDFEKLWGRDLNIEYNGTASGEFNTPVGIEVDSIGNVYVADTNNHRIQVFDPDGNFLRQWGRNGGDGTYGIEDGEFNEPWDISINSTGHIFVTDCSNHRIQVFDSAGNFIDKFGANGGNGSIGTGDGEFDTPGGLTFNESDYLYVNDWRNNRIEVFDPLNQFQFSWVVGGGNIARSPFGIAINSSGYVYTTEMTRINCYNASGGYQYNISVPSIESLCRPYGIAINDTGHLYIADTYNHRMIVLDNIGNIINNWSRQIEGSGLLENYGTYDGHFNEPMKVAFSPDSEYVYVTDSQNHRIQVFYANGTFKSKWGKYEGVRYGSAEGEFDDAHGIAFNGTNCLYVADSRNNRIQIFDSEGNYLFHFGGIYGNKSGEFKEPWDVAIHENGDIYISDTDNHRIQVFTYDGQFKFMWGQYGPNPEDLYYPTGIAFDNENNLLVSDMYTDKIKVFSDDGTYISQFGGSGTDDGEFDWPTGIGVNSSGYIYISDEQNNRVQIFDPFYNHFETWGANGGDGTIGTGIREFCKPGDIVIDWNDNVYISEIINHRIQIIDKHGEFVQFIGRNNGDGTNGIGPGEFDCPYGIALNSDDQLFISESKQDRIQIFNQTIYSDITLSLGEVNHLSRDIILYSQSYNLLELQIYRSEVPITHDNYLLFSTNIGTFDLNSFQDQDLLRGEYHYIVASETSYGTELSNIISVKVGITNNIPQLFSIENQYLSCYDEELIHRMRVYINAESEGEATLTFSTENPTINFPLNTTDVFGYYMISTEDDDVISEISINVFYPSGIYSTQDLDRLTLFELRDNTWVPIQTTISENEFKVGAVDIKPNIYYAFGVNNDIESDDDSGGFSVPGYPLYILVVSIGISISFILKKKL